MSTLTINNLAVDKTMDRDALATIHGGGWPLYFDEADALFGKRIEVKDSHDRYSAVERTAFAFWM